jgi:uncharacterized protein
VVGYVRKHNHGFHDQKGRSMLKADIAKHSIGFEHANSIYDSSAVDRADNREDCGKKRIIGLGMIEDVMILVIVHTDRDGTTHLISASTVHSNLAS